MKIPVARPIEDVIADLRTKMVRMLPGSQAVQASWSVLGRSQEMISMALNTFAEDEESRTKRTEGSEGEKFALDTFLWRSHGEYYAACQMVRALADAFKVESVTWKEVADAEASSPIQVEGQVSGPGSGQNPEGGDEGVLATGVDALADGDR